MDKSGGAGTDVKVYRMRYGEARQVAALLNDMFVGGGSSGLDPLKPINLSPVAVRSPSSSAPVGPAQLAADHHATRQERPTRANRKPVMRKQRQL